MPSPSEDKKAGEKTRQKLRDFGLPPEITEKPDLSLAEAYRELNAARERRRQECYGPIPPGDFGIVSESEGSMDVVGESHYRPALMQAFLAHAYDDNTAFAWAILTRDQANAHDDFAVRVEIHGRTVGYISQDESPEISEQLERIRRGAVCRATITTVDASMFGVTLDLDVSDLESLKARPAAGRTPRTTPSKPAPAAAPPPEPAQPPASGGCGGCLPVGCILLGILAFLLIVSAFTS